MSVELTYRSQIKTVETLEANVPAAAEAYRRVTHDQFDTQWSGLATSTPPVTKIAAFDLALTAGEATIDLTDMVGTNGAAVDGTGLRVQAIKFINKTGNANVMTLSKGASTGYDGLGADFSVTVPAGGEVLILTKDNGTDISGTNCNLDLAGTLTQTARLQILMG